MNNTSSNICPCCHSSNLNELYDIGYGRVCQCRACETAFTVFSTTNLNETNKIFAERDFIKARLYDQYKLRKVARRRLKVLTEFMEKGNILEFGSSTGEFLFESANKGFNITSADIHTSVLNINKTDRLKTMQKPDEVLSRARQEYDAIVAFHVVEHLSDPGEFFTKCSKILNPGGIFFIEVPNFDDITRKILKDKWNLFYDYHICHFTKRSIMQLLARHGYDVLSVRSVDQTMRYFTPIYHPLRDFLWDLLKSVANRQKNESSGNTEDQGITSFAGYTLEQEQRIMSSLKARIYRVEKGLMRVASKIVFPLSKIAEVFCMGSFLQIVAKNGKNEKN